VVVHAQEVVAFAAHDMEEVGDGWREAEALEGVQQAGEAVLEFRSVARVTRGGDDGDLHALLQELDDVRDHLVVALDVVPVGVNRPVGVERDERELLGDGVHLRDVEHMADLGEVGRDVAPARERGKLVVVLEGADERERRVEAAERGDEAAERAAHRVLQMLPHPPLQLLHHLRRRVCRVHRDDELDQPVLLLEPPLPAQHMRVRHARRPLHMHILQRLLAQQHVPPHLSLSHLLLFPAPIASSTQLHPPVPMRRHYGITLPDITQNPRLRT
jgi:hypothetical protein